MDLITHQINDNIAMRIFKGKMKKRNFPIKKKKKTLHGLES